MIPNNDLSRIHTTRYYKEIFISCKPKGEPQMLLQVKRWLPEREVVVVADSSYAVLELLAAVQQQLTVITR